jgi:DNA-binding response OmpR family regulator
LLVYPSPVPAELAQALDLADRPYIAVSTEAAVTAEQPDEGWAGAIVAADINAEGAWAICRALRKSDEPIPLVLLINGRQLDDLADRDALYDDFCLTPFHPRELDRRLTHALFVAGTGDTSAQLITYEDLVLNVETYQAAIAGRALELTYMEYELLKFLASNPGRVFTREVLLSRVWGYDYFGGARTVDVHIRRLRSKLGEEHAGMIQTVRSVGYSLGQSRWTT